MNKLFSFLAGALCGLLVGASTALLLAPESGEEMRQQARSRWEEAMREARQAMEQTQKELEAQFEQMKKA